MEHLFVKIVEQKDKKQDHFNFVVQIVKAKGKSRSINNIYRIKSEKIQNIKLKDTCQQININQGIEKTLMIIT